MPKIVIAVLDDSPVDQKIIQEWLKSYPQLGIELVSSNAFQFEKLLLSKITEIDIILVDFYLPLITGLELAQRFNVRVRRKIILFSNGYPGNLETIQSSGISGFVEKQKDKLVHAIFEVYAGRTFFDSHFLNYFEKRESEADTSQEFLDRLSGQEIEILNLLSCGLSYNDIALKIRNLSPRSVETYLFQIRKRFGLKNNVQLLKWAMIHGYIFRFDDLD